MTLAEYSALKSVHYSALKHMARSALHYKYACECDTQPDTDAMVLGRVVHMMVFEPERVETDVRIWDGRRAGKEWEAFCTEHAGRDILKPGPFETAKLISASARTAAGRLLSDGKSEVVMQWTDAETGVECHGRLDHISKGFGTIDLKTTNDASPIAFGRRAASLSYIVQAAMYTDGAEASGWGRLPYTFLAVEQRAPFAATLYTATDDHIELGRDTYRGWLKTVAACRESGIWPSYPPAVLSLPKWALPGEDNDLSELGLVFEET
jgi:PDDEXK-like domain of unknown function (DUF3799)